jgi:hypothetical protein
MSCRGFACLKMMQHAIGLVWLLLSHMIFEFQRVNFAVVTQWLLQHPGDSGFESSYINSNEGTVKRATSQNVRADTILKLYKAMDLPATISRHEIRTCSPCSDGLRAGRPGFHSRKDKLVFFFFLSTKIPIQWVPGSLSLRVKQPGRENRLSPPSGATVKDGGAANPLPHISYMV